MIRVRTTVDTDASGSRSGAPPPEPEKHEPYELAPTGPAGAAVAKGLGRRGALSVIDQVCSSASNFLVILLVARGATSTASSGTFTVAFGLLTFVLTTSRSTLGVPLATDLHRLEPADARMMVARSVACAFG
jgi:hypothetical protein